MITSQLRNGLLKLSKMYLRNLKTPNVLKLMKLKMGKLMSCQLNLGSLPQITTSNTLLLINSIANLFRAWLSEIFSNLCLMLKNSKKLLSGTIKIFTTNSLVILLHSRQRYSALLNKKLSYFYKCISTIFLSQLEITSMIASLF